MGISNFINNKKKTNLLSFFSPYYGIIETNMGYKKTNISRSTSTKKRLGYDLEIYSPFNVGNINTSRCILIRL